MKISRYVFDYAEQLKKNKPIVQVIMGFAVKGWEGFRKTRNWFVVRF